MLLLADTKFSPEIMSQEDTKAFILYAQQFQAHIYIVPLANGRAKMLSEGEACDI